MLGDLRANGWSLRLHCIVMAYRIVHFCSVWRKKNIINNLWVASTLVLYRLITECLFGYEIQAAASVGRRFVIHHGYGVVVNKSVAAGDDFTLRHGTTIDSLDVNSPSCLVIGNGVELGTSVTLFGDVAIGDNVTVDAGGVAVDSVPDNTLVVDEKARVKVIG